MLEIGSLVDGKYRVLSKVGQGGMSIVYLAMNERANKQWAIKEVRKDGTQDFQTVKQNLIVETDMLKKLHHPYLPSIVDVIDTQDSFLIVMDYIEGNSLSKALKEYGAQPQEYVIEWGKQLCDVLGYLHSREPAIIYRDMKPANVMLKPDGNVCLIDFGTAREYKTGNLEDTTCLGTRGYAAPEQYGGHGQTDARTDIYCLGATLFHLVTGVNPAQPPYEMKPITQINPTLSKGLEKVLEKCTRPDPEERYQSMAELMYALEHYDEMDVTVRRKQKHKMGVFVTMCVMTVLCLLITIGCKATQISTVRSTYEDTVRKAEQQIADPEMAYNTYMEAIEIEPKRGEAYLGVLNMYRSDNEFTVAEAQKVTEMLTAQTGSRNETNATRFQRNYSNSTNNLYAEFCYSLGCAYLTQYNSEAGNAVGYSQAGYYFNQAAGYSWSDAFGEKITRDLGDYASTTYNVLYANANTIGMNTVDYNAYYQSIMAICDEDWSAGNGYATFAVNLSIRIIENISGAQLTKFANAKLTQDQMTELAEHAYNCGMTYVNQTEDAEGNRARIQTAYNLALQNIDSYYSSLR